MAMLIARVVHRSRSFTLRDAIPCLSYSKWTVLTQNLTVKYQVAFKHKSKVLGRETAVCSLRPPSSLVVLPSKLFCSNTLIKCWHCSKESESHFDFCDHCNKLQPLDRNLNYYEIFGIKKSFTVDTKALTRKFRNLQTRFHPDKFSISLEIEQEYAVDHSSEINKAYRCLLNPVERALYLLDLAGQPLHEGQIDMDPEFLMEIMEVNEDLAEATDKEAVADIGQKNQKILDRLLLKADDAFSVDDIKTARSVVAKIKYYNNIYLKVRDYERQHGILDL